MPNQFTYLCYKDQGITGRFEVTVHKNESLREASEGTGELIHSKDNSVTYPSDNYGNFIAAL